MRLRRNFNDLRCSSLDILTRLVKSGLFYHAQSNQAGNSDKTMRSFRSNAPFGNT